MLIVDRQQKVLDFVKQRKTALLDELVKELSVSSSTIRRDLEVLETKGVIERTRAGAIYRGTTNGNDRVALSQRMDEQVDQKRAIGEVAASLIEPHMTVILDGGSTVVYAARQIVARPIQVVTNSLVIAHEFSDDEKVELIMIGGSLYPRAGVTVGPIANGCLAELHADMALFSIAGIYGNEAFNFNLSMAEVEQMMMRQAATSVMLTDSSKFGRKSLVRVCGLAEVDQIITDNGIDDLWKDELGDRLFVAQ